MNSIILHLLDSMIYLIAAIPFLLIYRLLEIRKRRLHGVVTTIHRELSVVIMILFLVFIESLTIAYNYYYIRWDYIFEHSGDMFSKMNIIPFKGIIAMLSKAMWTENVEIIEYVLTNIIGNVVMFMPLGYLIALLSKKEKRMKYTILTSASISLLIETVQILIQRGSDIDDIILNTFGAFLGLIIFNFFEKHFPMFFLKFVSTSTKEELSYKEKKGVIIIKILEGLTVLIMLIMAEPMLMFLNRLIR